MVGWESGRVLRFVLVVKAEEAATFFENIVDVDGGGSRWQVALGRRDVMAGSRLFHNAVTEMWLYFHGNIPLVELGRQTSQNRICLSL